MKPSERIQALSYELGDSTKIGAIIAYLDEREELVHPIAKAHPEPSSPVALSGLPISLDTRRLLDQNRPASSSDDNHPTYRNERDDARELLEEWELIGARITGCTNHSGRAALEDAKIAMDQHVRLGCQLEERERKLAEAELERVRAENAKLVEQNRRLTEDDAAQRKLAAVLGMVHEPSTGPTWPASWEALISRVTQLTESERLVSELRAELAKREAVGAGAEELRPMFLDAPRDGACKACGRLTTARVGGDGFCSQCRGFRNIWLYAREHKCRACNQTLELENFRIADGCPCNAPRGINHGLVPILTCTCETCDPKQTGATRYWELTALEQPQAGPGRENE